MFVAPFVLAICEVFEMTKGDVRSVSFLPSSDKDALYLDRIEMGKGLGETVHESQKKSSKYWEIYGGRTNNTKELDR